MDTNTATTAAQIAACGDLSGGRCCHGRSAASRRDNPCRMVEQQQRRHEAPELGDAIVRMMRGLVTRASEGDTEAIEQLARIEQLAPQATTLSVQLARGAGRFGYSFTQLGAVLGVSRQAARQRVERGAQIGQGIGHVLMPGHRKATCIWCTEQLRELAGGAR